MNVYKSINHNYVFSRIILSTLLGSTIFSFGNLNVEAKNSLTVSNENQEQIDYLSKNLISLENTNNSIQYRKGGSNSDIPYIITPRYTLISDNTPTLHWNEVEGASSYLVKIQGGDINWQQEVKDTTVVYSGAEMLKSGIDYFVSVEADTGVSSLDDSGAKLGFRLITSEQSNSLQGAIAPIQTSNLSQEEKGIKLAEKYHQLDLNADAIAILEQLKTEGSKSAQVYRLLGDTYAKTGLNLLAEENYLTAIELESANNNLESVTEIQASLVGVKIMLGKLEEAEELNQQAQAGYSKLGNVDKGQELNRTLTALTQGNSENPIRTRGSSQQTNSAQNQIDQVVTPNFGNDWP
ncbi:tetratricopeptide repeat protein [Cyanobacterium aponinum]|uniref:Uncharacterized protein n=1 Tax=Cyanobacterium aponinum 0216 TaxID=2676140 RepID=A0A844GZY8_9CHRO|nr:tetratricopeptide repeat protein [Cyanobacterium aponinum]MTF39526.1 hypothetical protein [Cyanobacterium aponinum 0216]